MPSPWRSLYKGLRDELGSRIGAARSLVHGDPYQIAPYRSFGTADRAFVMGRVLEDEGIVAAEAGDSSWRNLLNTLRRLESDEVGGAIVRVRGGDRSWDTATDAEGFFRVELAPAPGGAPAPGPWRTVALELLSPRRDGAAPVRATADVLVPPATATLGVISDIDDTVLQSSVTDAVQMARLVFFGNARTRLPFPGVAAFYQALHHGAGGPPAGNPLFYVSSSPWNFYDMLAEFLELQAIPRGPLMLRDWELDRHMRRTSRHGTHKHGAITQIFDAYPALPFILIGDSGQEDPEIYAEVVRRYPRRVLAIYIRNILRAPERIAAVRALAAEVESSGSALVLADDTMAAARHAAERGWIDAAALADIEADKRRDEAPDQPRAETVVVEGEKPPVQDRPGGAAAPR